MPSQCKNQNLLNFLNVDWAFRSVYNNYDDDDHQSGLCSCFNFGHNSFNQAIRNDKVSSEPSAVGRTTPGSTLEAGDKTPRRPHPNKAVSDKSDDRRHKEEPYSPFSGDSGSFIWIMKHGGHNEISEMKTKSTEYLSKAKAKQSSENRAITRT